MHKLTSSPIPQLDGMEPLDIVEPVKAGPKCQFVKGGYSCSEIKLKFEGSTAMALVLQKIIQIILKPISQGLAFNTLHLR